jgi:hypothetical protein
MARQSSLARWMPRPQVLLPILLVAFVAVWLTAFPLWPPHAPTERAGAFGGRAWLVDVGIVLLFGGALALAALQWGHSRRKDQPRTKDQEVKESLEARRRA